MTRHRRVTKQDKVEAQVEYSSKIQTTKLIKPANPRQCDYIDSIKDNIITFCVGVSGVGKSLLALHEGIKLINSESSPIEKIFYIRSNIGMNLDKDLGYLPGDLSTKILPLAYPVLDNLIEFTTEATAKYLIESGKIEVLPVSMVRGRSFKNAFICLDEAQNGSVHMLKTVLTRISEGSKMVIMGDYDQCDFKDGLLSGFREVVTKLKETRGIGIVEFTKRDIIRHPIISHILNKI